jgi:hypothetical protein
MAFGGEPLSSRGNGLVWEITPMNSAASNSASKSIDETTNAVERLSTEHPQPVIVDLGKNRKSHIRALKQGEGKLMAEISRIIDEVRENLADELAGKHLLPVVILYKTKRRRRSRPDPIG